MSLIWWTGKGMLKESKKDIVEPLEIMEDELLAVHTPEYLNSLKVSPTHSSCVQHHCSYNCYVNVTQI